MPAKSTARAVALTTTLAALATANVSLAAAQERQALDAPGLAPAPGPTLLESLPGGSWPVVAERERAEQEPTRARARPGARARGPGGGQGGHALSDRRRRRGRLRRGGRWLWRQPRQPGPPGPGRLRALGNTAGRHHRGRGRRGRRRRRRARQPRRAPRRAPRPHVRLLPHELGPARGDGREGRGRPAGGWAAWAAPAVAPAITCTSRSAAAMAPTARPSIRWRSCAAGRAADPRPARDQRSSTSNRMPAACTRATSASPMAWAVVTWPAVGGRSSWARHSAAWASILAVSP